MTTLTIDPDIIKGSAIVQQSLPSAPPINTVVVHSGGMDSTALLAGAIQRPGSRMAVSFNYGQRHLVELDHAAAIAGVLGVEHKVVPVALRDLAPTSSLTGDTAVPEGHYAEDTMSATVVPNRNMTFISLAAAMAGAMSIENDLPSRVLVGVHAGDHFVYPDCRPDFIDATARAIYLASEGRVTLEAPFVNWSKADIAYFGHHIGAPLEMTWSCYKGQGGKHCGRCGTCVERAEAFAHAGVPDPTEYDDPEFWENAVATATQGF